MAEQLLKKQFKSETAENLDAYMKAQKVGLVLRKVVANLTIYEEWSKDGDTYTVDFTSTFKNSKITFKMGEEFVNTGPDGRTMKMTFYEEDGKVVCDQTPTKDGDVPCKIVREPQPDGSLKIIFTSVPDNTVCTRIFSLYKQK